MLTSQAHITQKAVLTLRGEWVSGRRKAAKAGIADIRAMLET